MRRKAPIIIGWTLAPQCRHVLLARFPPAYPDVIAHHVTLQFNAPPGTALPQERSGAIVGHVDDGTGLEALVLRIGGTTYRPSGGTYHITWSLDRQKGRKPVDSNVVIVEQGWREVGPVEVHLLPARL